MSQRSQRAVPSTAAEVEVPYIASTIQRHHWQLMGLLEPNTCGQIRLHQAQSALGSRWGLTPSKLLLQDHAPCS